jgi:hypothetical protein
MEPWSDKRTERRGAPPARLRTAAWGGDRSTDATFDSIAGRRYLSAWSLICAKSF